MVDREEHVGRPNLRRCGRHSGHCIQQQHHVGDATTHGPAGGHGDPVVCTLCSRNSSRRWPEPDDSTKGCGIADGTTQIGAVGYRQRAACKGCCGSATRTASAPCRVPGVPGQPVNPVERVGPGPELGGIGLPDHDNAGGGEHINQRAVGRRYVIGIHRASVGCNYASGV